VVVGIQHCCASLGLHVSGRHDTGFVHMNLQNSVIHVVVKRDDQGLEVLDYLVDVLDHASDGLVLVHHAIDAERPNGRTTQRGEQHTTDGVAKGVTKSTLKRLDHELRNTTVFRFLGGLDALRQYQSGEIYLHIVLQQVALVSLELRSPVS
jgi:hypothetical protein